MTPDLTQILTWTMSGAGPRVASGGALFLVVMILKKWSAAGNGPGWLHTDEAHRWLLWLTAKRKKAALAVLLAVLPAVGAALVTEATNLEVAATALTALLTAMGVQGLQKAARTKPAAPSPDDTAPPRGPSVVAASLLAVALALGATGCEMLPTLAKVASGVLDGVAFVRDAVTSADAAADAYFARHPNAEAERRVDAELAAMTADLDALDAAAGEGHDTGPLVDRVIARWPQFVALLKELRILSAAPPDGGPETEAPLPEPIELPTTEEVAARLGRAG